MISLLQRTWFNIVLPLDQVLAAHRLIAAVIYISAIIHGGLQLGNYFGRVYEADQWGLEATGLLQVFITGWILTLVMVLIWVTTRDCVRRSGKFEAFWYASS